MNGLRQAAFSGGRFATTTCLGKNKLWADRKMGLQDLVEGFLFSLQAEGRAPRTIEYYREKLHLLLGYAQDKGWSDGLSLLDTHRVRELLS